MSYWRTAGLALSLLASLSGFAQGAEAPPREDLGRSVKLMILVDKVMQPTAKWVSEEWMIQATAEAGFNVFSPRAGHDRLDEVRDVTLWCQKYGIYHMPWMRGSLAAPSGAEADGKRMLWETGVEQPLWSPNSDEFWEWTTRYIVEYAKISAENPHLMGVFLDYENYAEGRAENCYALSYDNLILGKFAAAKNIQIPELAGDKRKAWLDEQGLHAEFEAFQVNHWRERCRALRQAVDAIDPTFQFCIYPAPGTPFMVQAAYPEWATAQAPLILADACTYGRPSKYMLEQEALKSNRGLLEKRMQVPREAGIPFIYTGGIDPVVRGADPEFSGKNAVAISESTGGYWIFYEGPKYEEDHPEYWKWFTWANTAIREGRFETQYQPRETPEQWARDLLAVQDSGHVLVPPDAGSVEYTPVRLRHESLLVVAGKAGQPVRIALKHAQVGHYEAPVNWEVFSASPSQTSLGTGSFTKDAPGNIEFTPPSDGLYMVAVSAGPCAIIVQSCTAPLAIHTHEGLNVIHGADKLYFHVPRHVERFWLEAQGAGRETVRLNVLNPEGSVVATGQTTPAKQKTRLDIESGEHRGGIWSVQLTRADEGTLEDAVLRLDPCLPQCVSLSPEHVFRMEAPPANE